MPHELVRIETAEGRCPAYVCTSARDEPRPAAILFMDAGGIRPVAIEMAQRLADAGYTVLLPDPFYRFGPYEPLVPKEVFAGDVRASLGPLMATTSTLKAATDAEAFLAYLATRSDVAGDRVVAVGFCMGGGMAICSAAAHSGGFAGVASFHGGDLAIDSPASPHLAAPRLKAKLYIAAATDDMNYPPAMAERFERSLEENGVSYRAETYDAPHGWMVPDFPVYDPAEAERGWQDLLSFFAATSRG